MSSIHGSICISSGGLCSLSVSEAQKTLPAPDRKAEMHANIPAPSIDLEPPRQINDPLEPL